MLFTPVAQRLFQPLVPLIKLLAMLFDGFFQRLITRAEENALRQESRLDQKRMDEFAQRAALRKGE